MRLGVLAVALAATLAGCGGSPAAKPAPEPLRGTEAQGRLAQPTDFELTDQDGRAVRLSAQRGKLVLISFLYTHCPDVCPLTAVALNQALRDLGPDRSRVRSLAVSVDPAGDTPAAVRAFVRTHRLVPEFRYLTAPRRTLARVWRAYYVATERATGNPAVGHSAYVLLVDAEGRGVVRYGGVPLSADVLHDLRVLLRDG